MQRISYTVLLILITLASCSGGGQYNEMRQRLDALNELNRADSVLTATERDEAQTLVNYFDSHGTPNDQLLAHYLLGRCYADMNEAPIALHCYQEAISRADTLSPDCDFAQLSRVYGQSATIFYQQGLYRNQLEYEDFASTYAWRGNDTLAALQCHAMKALAYDQLQMKDSAIFIYMDAISQMKAYNYNKVAAGYSGALAKTLIDKGEDDKALPYMIEHELYSGYFDDAMNISAGREVYYFFKGLYYLREQQLDSSEFFFRKELRTGRDFNNQNYGSRGLALLYQQKHMSDSAAKYALYAYDMNDSCFVQMTTHEIEQAKAMYDYSRLQESAQQEKNKADIQTIRLLTVCIVTILLLIVLGIVVSLLSLQQKKRKTEKARYYELLKQLEIAQAEIVTLHDHEAEFHRLIDKKESYIDHLDLEDPVLAEAQSELSQLREKERRLNTLVKEKEKAIADQQAQLAVYEQRQAEFVIKEQTEQEKLSNITFYQELQGKTSKGDRLSEDDWKSVDSLVKEELPDFYEFLSMKKNYLNETEYRVCVLLRLYLPGKSVAAFIGIAPSYITKYRKDLHKKLFQGNGDSKAFVKILRAIG